MHVLRSSEDLASAPSSSTLINTTLLYLFFKAETRNFNVSIWGLLILDRNSNVYEVEVHTSKIIEANPLIILTLKKVKSSQRLKPGSKLDRSIYEP